VIQEDKYPIGKLSELIERSRNILIGTHLNADGDAIGSTLALALIFRKLGKSVKVVTPNDYPAFLQWMTGSEMMLVYRSSREQVRELVEKADLMIFVDFNDPKRLEKSQDILLSREVPRILIDHHPDPVDFTDLVFSEPTFGSCAELIYRIILDAGFRPLMDRDIAACLYAGIMTDTGSFSYSCSYPEIWHTVAELMSWDFDRDRIHALVYDNYSEKRMRLMGYCLNEKMRIFPEYSTGLISLSRREMEQFEHQPGDTEGFVNLPFNIKGVKFTALFLEKNNHVKISFRSRGTFAVNAFSRKHFRGGGHLNAAGGEWDKPLDEAVERFISLLPSYKAKLK
jgi:phosphoesterase RecJ-like protein